MVVNFPHSIRLDFFSDLTKTCSHLFPFSGLFQQILFFRACASSDLTL